MHFRSGSNPVGSGEADGRIRTGDLILTKDGAITITGGFVRCSVQQVFASAPDRKCDDTISMTNGNPRSVGHAFAAGHGLWIGLTGVLGGHIVQPRHLEF